VLELLLLSWIMRCTLNVNNIVYTELAILLALWLFIYSPMKSSRARFRLLSWALMRKSRFFQSLSSFTLLAFVSPTLISSETFEQVYSFYPDRLSACEGVHSYRSKSRNSTLHGKSHNLPGCQREHLRHKSGAVLALHNRPSLYHIPLYL